MATAPAPAPAAPTKPTLPTTHTIVKGDTLTKLAVTFYGKGSEWKKIWDANRKVLKNPDKLTVGVAITIPA